MTRGGDKGFTLIEVTFALMLMTLGLFALFHLFPSGLRASVDANAFTRQAMFAEDCFGAIRAQADEGWGLVFTNNTHIVLSDDTTEVALDGEWSDPFVYPYVDPSNAEGDPLQEYMRCKVSVTNATYLGGSNSVLGQVTVQVRDGRVGSLSATFYTELYNGGM